MSAVIWASPQTQQALSRARPLHSADEFVSATRDASQVGFVDTTTLNTLATRSNVSFPGPIIAVCDDSLPTAIAWMRSYPWISHAISGSMLRDPLIDRHLENVMHALGTAKPRLLDWLDKTIAGRRVRLTHSNQRTGRLDRMVEFLGSSGASTRIVERLRDVTEELLTNAFYDAPVAAGAVSGPVPRTHDVVLPDEHACDLSYGCGEDLVVVQIRDPFGSLSRRRLFEVLGRCAAGDMSVQVDETMGGAGLGMWRIFTHATFVAISVMKNHHTEILVGIAKRSGPKRPFAVHLFFAESTRTPRWKRAGDDGTQPSAVNKSVLLKIKSGM